MKKQTFLGIVASTLVLAAACSSSNNSSSDNGGSTGDGSGGSKSGTGGSVGSGGKSGGSGGAASGGALGSGGMAATGGAVGSGGSGPGTGGEAAGGSPGSGGATGSGGTEGGGGMMGSGGAGGMMGSGGSGGSAAGGNTISGTVHGKPFTKIGAAYMIGMPDKDPNGLTVTVIYLFESAFPCSKFSKVGWDVPGNLGNIQVVEMRALGPTPGTFKVVGPPPPTAMATASGEVAVNQVDNTRAAAPEQIFNGGTVTIDKVTPKMSASGSFDIKFSMGSLKGTFDAGYCATGVEP
jgi:hypothetical protein